MNRIINILIIAIFVSAICSCQVSYDIPEGNEHEDVNGFQIHWRKQITDDQKSVVRDILSDMVFVKGGFFVMGATPEQSDYARANEYPNIYVSLSDYYVCRYEVTDEQFTIITGIQVSSTEKYSSRISYNDWDLFIEILSDLTSIPFSLPTEAQWEYAARGGELSKGYIYPGSNDIDQIRSCSHTEGSNTPNELGIYNMADLKSEWCADFYELYQDEYHSTENREIKNGKYHVVRGGNYLCTKETEKYYPSTQTGYSISSNNNATMSDNKMDFRHCRITSRSYGYENGTCYYIGCRLVINYNNSTK